MKRITFAILLAVLLAMNISALEFDCVYDGADLYTDEEETAISLSSE